MEYVDKLSAGTLKFWGGKIAVMNTFGGRNELLPPGSEASNPEHVRFAMLELEGPSHRDKSTTPNNHRTGATARKLSTS